ncbi:hypothetical protein RGR602_CH03114 [Rhizobium gallicum bv. gallicum R602sp]|uniref:Uncharacterized protein n=1 Tax=Rhizobium gallicum bv. gallicum R602sp TaxID=1041138 RepID=A0A0B4X5L1_9HYPH|nr:hypothetical protein RGR602_CH03114 [Rhizobium gallicum bv. gallicum R602sp]
MKGARFRGIERVAVAVNRTVWKLIQRIAGYVVHLEIRLSAPSNRKALFWLETGHR